VSKTWDELSAEILNLAAGENHREDVARLIAQLIPSYLQGPHVGRYFNFWEKHGFHVTPVHFYQPVPDTRALSDHLWALPSMMVGVEMNEAAQLRLLRDVFPRFRDEYNQLALTPTGRPHEFYLSNGAFEGTDALVLYCMMRHFKPKLMLEVGAGFSSRLAARAALRNGNTKLTCIEPYPDAVLRKGFLGLSSLITKRVQDVGLELFQTLGAGDILFIDSSHVVKCGGDVNYLILEVLPRLHPGVIVHLHDIFLPWEMPKSWIMEHHLFWTEQYLLQAFLTFNLEFEVLFANNYMGVKHRQEMRAAFPTSQWWGGGSFWIRRKLE
jgi:hypothetical protein